MTDSGRRSFSVLRTSIAGSKAHLMAYFDGKRIIWFEPKEFGVPDWLQIDCGCCAGIQWGGDSPVECSTCEGGGYIYKHKKSGVLALYPGGPFCGRDKLEVKSNVFGPLARPSKIKNKKKNENRKKKNKEIKSYPNELVNSQSEASLKVFSYEEFIKDMSSILDRS